MVVESLLESLEKPDKDSDETWANEAEKRLEDYSKNKVETIPFHKIFD